MRSELVSDSHSVGESNFHLQFTPAYRRDIFADECVKILTRDYISAAARHHGITISVMSFGPDHLHVFVSHAKNLSLSRMVGILKGFSSRMMRKNHFSLFREKLWGDKFWSEGYFYRSVGSVNAETARRYIEESQQKHWTATDKAQKTLIEF